MTEGEKLYDAIDRVPHSTHIAMKWDWVASIWIVTLDGRGGGCEDNIVSVSNQTKPDYTLHELVAFANEEYERKFGR